MNSLIIEQSCTFAHHQGLNEINVNLDIYKDESAEMLVYTEEFQKIFDRWYDYFYDELTIFANKINELDDKI